jgi:sulfofructose kinase
LAKAPKILCAGGAVQDIIMRVDDFPAAGSKVQASEFMITSGGQAGNAAVAVARLGAQCSYIGALGDHNDEVANTIVKTFAGEGIDVSQALRVPGARSSVSLIMIDKTGEKMIATRRDTGLKTATHPHPEAVVAGLDAVLLDNRYDTLTLPICKAAQARNIPRVLDLDKPSSSGDPLVMGSTHVIASAEAMRESTGLKDYGAALKKFSQVYKGFLAVTDGPAGCYWLDGGEVRHMDAFKVDAIDTLGAGDTFHGSFTVALGEGQPLTDAIRFASATAALKCIKFGGMTGAPNRAEVEAFLRERS